MTTSSRRLAAPLLALTAALAVLGQAAPALADTGDVSSLPAPLQQVLPTSVASQVAVATKGSGVKISALVHTAEGAKVVSLDAASTSSAKKAVADLAAAGVAANLTVPAKAVGSAASVTPVYQWNNGDVQAGAGKAEANVSLNTTTVAVLDTGVTSTSLLNLVPGQNFTNATPDTDTHDTYGHGTHVAGTVGAIAGPNSPVYGVAAGVNIMPVKVLSDSGSGNDQWIASGIEWAISHGANVISMSIGSSMDSAVEQSAITDAVNAGVVVVAAAGNYAQQGNYMSYPCGDIGSICVGAYDYQHAIANFSEHNSRVDISAPGVSVASLNHSDLTTPLVESGTSMATPHVSAAAAILKAIDPALTPAQVLSYLTSTSTDYGTPGRDDYFGAGALNVKAAVEAVMSAKGKSIPTNHSAASAPTLSVSVHEGTSAYIPWTLTNDPDGDPLVITSMNSGLHGVTGHNETGYYYSGSSGGSDHFSYTATDQRGGTVTGWVNGTVIPQINAPTNFVARPGDSSANLSWTAPSGADHYRLWVNGTIAVDNIIGTVYTLTGLQNGTPYTISVQGVDSSGTPGNLSGQRTVTPAAPPAAPAAPATPTGLSAAQSGTNVQLSWTAVSGATSYTVYRDGSLLMSAVPSSPFMDINPLTGTHTYTVSAVNAGGESPASSGAPVTFTPAPQPLPAPANFHAIMNGTSVTLTWDAVSGAASYQVFRGANAIATPTTNAFVDGNVTPGTYTYTVATLDGSNNMGPATSGITLTIPTPAPPHQNTPTEDLYASLGGAGGVLGSSTESEHAVNGGSVQHFRNGAIYTLPGSSTAFYTEGVLASKYDALGGPQSFLGWPTMNSVMTLTRGGAGQYFQGGGIYYSPASGAHVLNGAILSKWQSQGYEGGFLGYPTTDAFGPLLRGGWGQHFQGGSIYWSPQTGSHFVNGAIRDQWSQTGWENGFLGYPTTDAFGPLLRGGWGQHFQGGSIYWSPQTGSHFVNGAIRDQWSWTGWENGGLGYPTTNMFPTKGGGWGQHFQGGSIYWSPWTGVHLVNGALRDKWASWGWEWSGLGYPTSNPYPLRSGGWAQNFEGGTEYWTPWLGTHVVSGALMWKWSTTGYENGWLGYATTDAFCGLTGGGCGQHFEGGSLYWSPATGAWTVAGAFRDTWAARGWENGRLGYPTSDAYNIRGGSRQNFRYGTITQTIVRHQVRITISYHR